MESQLSHERHELKPSPGVSNMGHISQYQNAAALQLAKPEARSLVVRACGRSVMLPEGVSRVTDIQGVLQVELGMRDQVFEVYDANGMQVMADSDLAEAIRERRLPLTAT